MQTENDRGHDISAFTVGFEKRFPIAISALIQRKFNHMARYSIKTLDFVYNILDFNSVCTYILHCSRTCFAWNIRQVLSPPKIMLRRPAAEVIEHDTCTDFNIAVRGLEVRIDKSDP